MPVSLGLKLQSYTTNHVDANELPFQRPTIVNRPVNRSTGAFFHLDLRLNLR